MSLVFVSVFREAYDRTKPTEEGRASALRGRLQSVDPTKLNNALAPRAAGRAEASLRALLLVLWRATRTGREKEVARFVRALRQRRCHSVRLAFTSARRYFRGIPPSCQSRRGYRSPGYMLPPDGRGYDKQGGYIEPHIGGRRRRAASKFDFERFNSSVLYVNT